MPPLSNLKADSKQMGHDEHAHCQGHVTGPEDSLSHVFHAERWSCGRDSAFHLGVSLDGGTLQAFRKRAPRRRDRMPSTANTSGTQFHCGGFAWK
jgi:hypothetical protein